MDWKHVEAQWKQLQDSAKSKWAKLTDEDLEFISGKRDFLVLMIQERYGIAIDEAERQVNEWKLAFEIQPGQSQPVRKAG